MIPISILLQCQPINVENAALCTLLFMKSIHDRVDAQCVLQAFFVSSIVPTGLFRSAKSDLKSYFFDEITPQSIHNCLSRPKITKNRFISV